MKKLKLQDLKVQSFVTAFDLSQGETLEVKGGYYTESCGCGGGSGSCVPCTTIPTGCGGSAVTCTYAPFCTAGNDCTNSCI